MTLPIYRLRRWLAAIGVLFTVIVAGMYFYARMRQANILKTIPGKIGVDIQQTARGFKFSKSDGGRTLFTIEASDLKKFKLNGRSELHNVSIVLYGRDSSRFDQIYGDNFSFDQDSGDVTAKGDVQIDLEANPGGVTSPDQSAPKELKNAIHLRTRDLVFNNKSGNAMTAARVEFRTPQATGWAVGVQYAGKENVLTLLSQVHVSVSGQNAAQIEAMHGVITNEPRVIVLDHPRLQRKGGVAHSERATFYLGEDNNVERVLASGDVHAEQIPAGTADPSSHMRARADEAELFLSGKQNQLQTATLTGNVQMDRVGSQPMQGKAGRVVMDFAGRNEVRRVHAAEGVHLIEIAANSEAPKTGASKAQNFDLTAPIIDFTVAKGRFLDRAETSGAAQITITPAETPSPTSGATVAQAAPPKRTVVTAGKFTAKFAPVDGRTRLTAVHGAPGARVVSVNPGEPDRVSTSQTIDAAFLPQGGIESIVQQGEVIYSDNLAPEKRTQAFADSSRYTPADQMLTLAGRPRVTGGGMATTAKSIRIDRATGDALADGDVKSTYSELKEQPNGALLASASPIHVTSRSMTTRKTPGVALYTGNARLWQDANVIEAPSIEFDHDRRFVIAQGTATRPVSTIVVQPEKPQTEKTQPERVAISAASTTNVRKNGGKVARSGPIAITGSRLTYADADRKAHYEGGVVAKGVDFTASSKTMEVYLLPRSQVVSNQSVSGSGQLDRMVAQGNVVVQEPSRRANGQNLVYYAADDKFVLTGGPPSIFDAEQGKITGVSLTFFRRDDRVLVEGEASTPVVTQTRVAR
jgi:lipopolysaccharide export system protein LptA